MVRAEQVPLHGFRLLLMIKKEIFQKEFWWLHYHAEYGRLRTRAATGHGNIVLYLYLFWYGSLTIVLY
jgi:hypothetical protein